MDKHHGFYTARGYEILNQHTGKLTSSLEDYLEMLYRHHLEEGYSRISTLAEQLNVKASSASKVVQKLAQMGYVDYEKYKIIRLTEKGLKAGEFLLKRHEAVQSFLLNIGVKDSLQIETELIEHQLGKDTLEKLILFNEFIELHPEIKAGLLSYINEKSTSSQ